MHGRAALEGGPGGAAARDNFAWHDTPPGGPGEQCRAHVRTCCSTAGQIVSFCGRPLLASHGKTPPQRPLRLGSLPLRRPAREGVHSGAAEYHCVSFSPCDAMRSMCGVEVVGAPKQPRSP
jgi:hypothetical protein